MPYATLDDRLLRAEGILANLQQIKRELLVLQERPAELDIQVILIRKLTTTRRVLSSIFFDGIAEAEIQKLLSFHVPIFFRDYPLLGEALSIIFLNTPSNSDDLNSMITSLEAAIGTGAKTDWCPTEARLGAKYDALNTLHRYFPDRLKEGPAIGGLFKELVVACRKVCVLIEKNNTADDGMAYDYAYKLMALLIDVGHKPPSLESLSEDIHKLLTSLESKEKPFHNCLLDLRLPRADALRDKAGWVSFVKKFDGRALRFFSSAIKIEEMSDGHAPLTLEQAAEALAKARYKRHLVDTEWTQLCSRYNVPESTFNAGLDYIVKTPGWPKKEKDSIPELEVDIEHEGYIWTKLSASDKRGLILGKITNCCQSIDGHSLQCVDDAMRLGTNALYVLLKRTGKAHAAHKKTDGSINDDDYQIIGQSYVWKSKNGNLCLDSVECLTGRVRPAVTPEGQEEQQQKVKGLADLREILHRFGQQILAFDTSIKRVTLGTGGNTPRGLFDEVMIPEAISQGHFYGDAERQYLIARKSPLTEAEELDLSALCASCVREPGEFYECMRYLSEQMGDTRDFTNGLSRLIQTYPGFPDLFTIEALHRLLHFTSAPTFNDLVPIDFTSLESMPEGGISSTGHLMWQANTPEKIIKALPCMPPEDRLVAVMEDRDGRTVLHHSTENAESLAVIFKLLSKDEAMAALRDQDRRDQTSNRHPILRHAARYPKSLQLLLGFYSEDEALAAMMQSDPEGNTVLHHVAEHPDSLEVVLPIYPEEQRLAALSKKNGGYMSVLRIAISNSASLKVILSHLPDVARLAVLHDVLYHSLKDPESLKCLLNHYTQDQVLAAMEQVFGRDTTVLHHVAECPDSLKIVLSLYPEEQRLAALSKKNSKDETVLSQAVKNPESLRLIRTLLKSSVWLL